MTGEWVRAVILLVWGAFAISGVDTFLRPRLVGERVGLSEFVVFFGVLGPVVFAIAVAIIDVLADRTAISVVETSAVAPVAKPESQ
jgi:hypothetical protein